MDLPIVPMALQTILGLHRSLSIMFATTRAVFSLPRAPTESAPVLSGPLLLLQRHWQLVGRRCQLATSVHPAGVIVWCSSFSTMVRRVRVAEVFVAVDGAVVVGGGGGAGWGFVTTCGDQ
jgi:hypothetical protein